MIEADLVIIIFIFSYQCYSSVEFYLKFKKVISFYQNLKIHSNQSLILLNQHSAAAFARSQKFMTELSSHFRMRTRLAWIVMLGASPELQIAAENFPYELKRSS